MLASKQLTKGLLHLVVLAHRCLHDLAERRGHHLDLSRVVFHGLTKRTRERLGLTAEKRRVTAELASFCFVSASMRTKRSRTRSSILSCWAHIISSGGICMVVRRFVRWRRVTVTAVGVFFSVGFGRFSGSTESALWASLSSSYSLRSQLAGSTFCKVGLSGASRPGESEVSDAVPSPEACVACLSHAASWSLREE
jgi:hypothetical protein